MAAAWPAVREREGTTVNLRAGAAAAAAAGVAGDAAPETLPLPPALEAGAAACLLRLAAALAALPRGTGAPLSLFAAATMLDCPLPPARTLIVAPEAPAAAAGFGAPPNDMTDWWVFVFVALD